MFAWAPIVVLSSTFLMFVVIPFGPDLVFGRYDTGVFFVLALSSISVIGILMAGWASANKYSLMGGLRSAGQLIAYELPMVLAVLGVVIQAGTLDIAGHRGGPRTNGEIFGFGGIGNPYIITQFVGFLIFMIAMQAELTQPPFDMPVAESEIVAGYMTEYSGSAVPAVLHRRIRHRRVRSAAWRPRCSWVAGPCPSSISTATS